MFLEKYFLEHKERTLKQCFNVFDANRSGDICATEVSQMAARGYLCPPPPTSLNPPPPRLLLAAGLQHWGQDGCRRRGTGKPGLSLRTQIFFLGKDSP